MILALPDRSTEQTGTLHTSQVETVLSYLYMSSKSLLLNKLESYVGSILFDTARLVDSILVSSFTDVTRHVFWHALSAMLGDIQVVSQGGPVALLAL
jgi:hypothetical protein